MLRYDSVHSAADARFSNFAQFLFCVVIILFGFMQLGALVGFAEDMKERRHLLQLVQQPEMGFTDRGNGVWTWTFIQNTIVKPVERPSGSAVQMAGIFGFPFIRLRAALPEELFAGSVAQALGRRDGMSVAGMEAARDENVAAMRELSSSMTCFGCGPAAKQKQIPSFEETSGDFDDDRDLKAKPHARVQSLLHQHAPAPVFMPAKDVPMIAMADYDGAVSMADVEKMAHTPEPRDLVGTTLMLAYMANQKVLPVVELSEKTEAAREHFRGVRVPGIDHDFDELLPKFMVMLGDEAGTLTSRAKWMQTARLWRLMLLQQEDGGWQLTDSLAFALEAHEGHPPPKQPKVKKGLAVLTSLCAGDGELDDQLDDAADDMMESDEDEPQPEKVAAQRSMRMGTQKLKRQADCPLTFSARAARSRMPHALLELNEPAPQPVDKRCVPPEEEAPVPALFEEPVPWQAGTPSFSRKLALLLADARAAEENDDGEAPQLNGHAHVHADSEFGDAFGDDAATGDPIAESPMAVAEPAMERAPVPIERIWATVLALNVLEGMDASWLLDDEAEEGEERTIVDAGHAFLEAQGAADERVQALLDSGVLQAEAEKAGKLWKKIMEHHIHQLRSLEVLNRFTALTHFQRATGRVIKSMRTDHDTFATFFDSDGYIMRWQRFMILVTLVLSTLLVSIWFYSSRGSQCCAELRMMLDTGAGQACSGSAPPAPPMSPLMPPPPPLPPLPPSSPVAATSSDAFTDDSGGSGCPPVGPCLGYVGNCADLQAQFATVQGCFVYGDPGAEEQHDNLDGAPALARLAPRI